MVEITQPQGRVNRMGVAGGLYDGKLGTMDPREKCETCMSTYRGVEGAPDCPGHFGHVEVRPAAVPLRPVAMIVTRVDVCVDGACGCPGRCASPRERPAVACSLPLASASRAAWAADVCACVHLRSNVFVYVSLCADGWRKCARAHERRWHCHHVRECLLPPQLAHPVFHIGFMDEVYRILQCVCGHCGRLRCGDVTKLAALTRIPSGKRRLTEAYLLCAPLSVCGHTEGPAVDNNLTHGAAEEGTGCHYVQVCVTCVFACV